LNPPRGKLGLWMIGAAGNVATTVAVGLSALRQELATTDGLVTERAPLTALPLRSLNKIVLGGHEISSRSVMETAAQLADRSGLFGPTILKKSAGDLSRFEENIRPGKALRCGTAIEQLATRGTARRAVTADRFIKLVIDDLTAFQDRHRLDRVVVINVASTEPVVKTNGIPKTWGALKKKLTEKSSPLPSSSLYAIAAIQAGMPYINFTPSLGADLPALRELAATNGVPIMGADGKTGETLLKTVLAPMFRERALQIDSWVGHNVLGNGDGFILDDAENKASKIGTKNNVVASIVGGQPDSRTSIEYVESLHDWKTAWDMVRFRGFLNTPMTLQFTWQGSDSILAAPLVIDLARLADYHAAHVGGGVMTHLASFFKSPMDVAEHAFAAQINMLNEYVYRYAPQD